MIKKKVMKNKIKFLLLGMIILYSAGCQKDNIMIFDTNDSGVVFPGAGDGKDYKGYNATDQTYYVNESFLSVPLTQNKYIVDFPIRISGDSAKVDRVVSYEILTEETTALSTQYKIVDALIPAG